jgi:hypothetical protein
MPTQRVTLAKIGGLAADAIEHQFELWSRQKSGEDYPENIQQSVDEFAEILRLHAAKPPVVYFSEWIDMWSMGDLILGFGNAPVTKVDGIVYQACCHRPPICFKSTRIGDEPTQESEWLLHRLREAENAWGELVPNYVIVVLRRVVGGLVEDGEIEAAQQSLPDWVNAVAERAK